MWVIFGLLSAFFDALLNINAKKNTKNIDSLVVSWLWMLCASPIVILPALFIGFAEVDKIFWIALLIRTILDTVAVILYVKALKESDISLSQPMLGLTPIFILVISYFLNGDVPSSLAFGGVVLVAVGIYFNNMGSSKGNILKPFLSIWRNRGTRLMALVAIIWSGTGSLHTLAIKHSDSFTYVAIGIPLIAFVLSVCVLLFRRNEAREAFNKLSIFQLIKIGLYDGFSLISQMIGQGLTQAVYLISLKRSSIIITAFLAKKEFGEKIKGRIFPIFLIVVGILLIVLFN